MCCVSWHVNIVSSVLFEAARAKSLVLQIMGQVVPGFKTGNRERLKTENGGKGQDIPFSIAKAHIIIIIIIKFL